MPAKQIPGLPTLDEQKNSAFGRMRRNLKRVASGSIIAQAVVAGSMPILTRLFSPGAFGVAALVTAAYGLLIPLVTLKYDQAVVMPKAESRVFTNVYNPQAAISRKHEYRKTLVKKGVTLGEYCFIGAGAVVNRNVKP